MKYEKTYVASVVLGAVVLIASHAGAQNLVVNGDFDSDVSSWTDTVVEGNFVFDALNDVGAASSGSGLMTITSTGTGWTGNAIQCIPAISDASIYDWGARVLIPSGHATTGEAYLQLVWYSTVACTGTPLATGTETNVVPHTMTDTWVTSRIDDQAPPAGAQSAIIVLTLSKTSAVQPLSAHFDGVFFGVDPIPVELQSFTIE